MDITTIGVVLSLIKQLPLANGFKYEDNNLYLTSNGEIISDPIHLDGSGSVLNIGEGLRWENDKLVVDTINNVEKDNTKPITSAAVYTTVGNIETFLKTI